MEMQNKNNYSIYVLGLNVRSLDYHMNELRVLLDILDKKPEVLALTEPWMTDDHSLVDLDRVGYQPIEFKARQNAKRRSGGVAFYVKDGLSFRVVPFKTDIERLNIKIIRENKHCSIYVQYFDQRLLKSTTSLTTLKPCCIF